MKFRTLGVSTTRSVKASKIATQVSREKSSTSLVETSVARAANGSGSPVAFSCSLAAFSSMVRRTEGIVIAFIAVSTLFFR